MKKFFLILCAGLAVSAAIAQTKDSPIVLTEGVTSTYTVESTWTHVYYEFTAPSDGSYFVNSDACYEYPYLDSFDGNSLSYGDPTAVAMTAGQKLYIDAYSPSSTEYDMTVTKLSDEGRTADNPAIIDPVNGGSFYTTSNPFYLRFTADRAALLKFQCGYCTITVNGASATPTYNSSTWEYEYKLVVEEGQTYDISFSGFYSNFTIVATVADYVAGSWDTPVKMQIGENSIPGTQTSCWFTLADASALGKLELSCASATTKDSVIVFNSSYYAQNFESSRQNASGYVAKSSAGSLNTSWTNEDAAATFYVFVGKASQPFPTTLNLALTAFEAGDVKASAIEQALPSTAEQTAQGLKWYKVLCPESSVNKMLNAKITSPVSNPDTKVVITYGYGYSAAEGNTAAAYEINSQYGDQVMFITVDNHEEGAISLAFSLDEIAAGESSSNPIVLTSGETYNIATDGNKFYSYTGTQVDLLTFVCSTSDMVVERTSVSNYSFTRDESQEGQTFYFNNGAVTSIFRVSGGKAGDSFTFTEGAYPAGKSISSAIECDGTYTLDAATQNIWIKYTAATDCILELASDIEYNYYNNTIEYYLSETASYGTSIANYNSENYFARFAVAAGAPVYVHVKLQTPQEGKVVTFTENEPAQGETPATAIAIYNNQTVTVPANSKVWYKFEALVTEYMGVNMEATDMLSIYKADTYEDACTNNTYYLSRTSWTEYTYTCYIQEGWNYLVVYNNQSTSVDLSVSGDITDEPIIDPVGIETVSATAAQSIYSLDGRQLNALQRGINVVDGQKIMVK